jgi:hypothetical protein
MVAWAHIIFAASIGLTAFEGIVGHMSMKKPTPRGSWDNPGYKIDYDLAASLTLKV